MASSPKVVSLLACGVVLCLGLSNPASAANDMKAGKSERRAGQVDQRETTVSMQGIHFIQGDVLRVEGTSYVVKGLDGKEVSLHADNTTVKTGNLKVGDRIEAKINEQHHALSILSVP
jgi:NMD protein affecting ribosome stability and mRNA decay